MIFKNKIVSFLGLFLFVTGISYFSFDRFLPLSSKANSPQESDVSADPSEQETGFVVFQGPKTEVCPLNGTLHTAEEEALWSQRRPLLVMIENHEDSRPQSGLSNADVVYEAVAEGGITRFMAIFYCGILRGASQKYDLGPVRSARAYFLDLASEYSDYPLYAHVGGANCSAPKDDNGHSLACTTATKAQALEQLGQYGWMNKGSWSDLNQFSLSYRVCRREENRTGQDRATEHSMYCSSDQLWQTATDRGLTNITEVDKKSWDLNFKSWSFDAEDKPASVSDTKNISFDFWSGYKQYAVSWQYDPTTNSYLRFNNGEKQIDFNNQETLSAKNIVIQFAKETRSVDEHLHNLYQVIGTGSGVLLQNGQKTDITWSKISRTARTVFKTKTGQVVNFVPGQIWIEILP
ncbi:DUF3048 domain-containing protein, partial [Patescibacteria group bacterium]|nr:DUF3048 domain-containing protein [Patescibacteria group bacterium]